MAFSNHRPLIAWAALAASSVSAQTINGFDIVGNTGVSAQQMFLGTPDKVYVVDKTEANGNGLEVNGHPTWATEVSVSDSSKIRSMDIVTNSFCAGGNVLGNGTWLNVGGNQPVGYGGLNAQSGSAPYFNTDGGAALRMLDPCDDDSCDWLDMRGWMTTRRWYPTLETLEDGSMIIIGGCDWGGFVNSESQNNPTIEYFPKKGDPIGLNILTTTLPANLFPLTWLLPSGLIFIQANLGTELFDYKNNVEHPLDNIPDSIVKTYPASAATAMMPLTPANNWTATIVMCGGTKLAPDQWVTTWNLAAYPAQSECVSMTPDISTSWVKEAGLPEARNMGNFIQLPCGRLLLLNGIATGVAGYGNTSWAIGQAFGTDPIYSPAYYDRNLPDGQRFYRTGMKDSTIPRLYHSTAILLPDGSVYNAGSNPNADYVAPGTPGYTWPTEYRSEKFYPDYYNKKRPTPSGLPTTIGYGGNYFTVKLSADDATNLDNTIISIVRTGFSTHAMNMGQRFVQLNNTYAKNADGSADLYVSQLPPNPAILVPGPAMMFVVVDGVPSNATWIMVGNGKIGEQDISPTVDLPGQAPSPTSSASPNSESDTGNNSNSNSNGNGNGAAAIATALLWPFVSAVVGASWLFYGF